MISSEQKEKKVNLLNFYSKVFLWINGKSKEHMGVIKIPPSINSVRRLRDYIASELKNKNSTDMVIYNFKGLELDDSDIYYINSGDVLCASLDGRAFESLNYINMYEIIKNVKAGGYGKVYIAVNVFSGEKVAIKKIDTGNLCKNIFDNNIQHRRKLTISQEKLSI